MGRQLLGQRWWPTIERIMRVKVAAEDSALAITENGLLAYDGTNWTPDDSLLPPPPTGNFTLPDNVAENVTLLLPANLPKPVGVWWDPEDGDPLPDCYFISYESCFN